MIADDGTSSTTLPRDLQTVVDEVHRCVSAPRATYRVQLHAGFTFDDAAAIVPYLAELGIDTLYASPHFKATPGSLHGYDVVDPTLLNDELGGEAGYERLHEALKRSDMKLLADIVPNHMGISNGANRFWQDVLENGRTSPYVDFFDIEWDPVKSELHNQVLLPVLGEQYGVVLEQGELKLAFEHGAFVVRYSALPLPIAPPTYAVILQRALAEIEEAFEPDQLPLLEYGSILAAFERLPPNETTDEALVLERQREQFVTKLRLETLTHDEPRIAAAIEQAIAVMNGDPADPGSFDSLDDLLNRQSYRLAFWRVAAEEINYRRFFAINDLAAVRQEVPAVFAESHRLVERLIAEGKIDGLRIDHPDGLWDPAGYFRDLQRLAFLARCRSAYPDLADWDDQGPILEAWWNAQWEAGGKAALPESFYVAVEKILEPGEPLPDDWPVSGTVGYEFARIVTGLFVDRSNEKLFNQWYERFTDEQDPFETQVYEAKRLILRVALSSELNVLAASLNRLSERRRRTRDFTLLSLRFALREVISSFPVYRTYVTADDVLTSEERRMIDRAIGFARRRNPASDTEVFSFLRDMLLGRDDPMDPEDESDRIRFVMRFQQLTGPVMAKGLEDTVFYRYFRMTALNEVGGNPAHFGSTVDEFHRHNHRQQRHWPQAMLASSTHDTKRSEDVRARIVTLSEYPREWRAAVNRWVRFNRKHRSRVNGTTAPTRNDEALFYQTLVGTWLFGAAQPEDDFAERIVEYTRKAAREAQLLTSWINPDEAYEAALERFVRRALDPKRSAEFLTDFAETNQEIERAGALTGLAMQALKLTAPGVPDLYQGSERWDLSLVDPDNRRPIDYQAYQSMLARVSEPGDRPQLICDLLDDLNSGAIKLFTTWNLLQLRKEQPDLFAAGDYLPVEAEGEQSERLIAFARTHGDRLVVVVAPRLLRSLIRHGDGLPLGEAVWGNTRILLPGAAGRSLRDRFTGENVRVPEDGRLPVSVLLAQFPLACLELMDDVSER